MRKGIAYIAIAAAIFTSCQKDLCYNHAHGTNMHVTFDWNGCTPDNVEYMRACFFPKNGGRPLTLDMKGANGGDIDLQYGDYSALFFNNNETDHLLVIDGYCCTYITTYDTDLLSAKSFAGIVTKAPTPPGAENDPVIRQPAPLYVDTCSALAVNSYSRGITLHPKSLVDTITIIVDGVDNLEHVLGMSAARSGMSRGVILSEMKPMESRCTMPLDIEVTGEKRISGQMLTFGYSKNIEQGSGKNMLTIYTMLKDGKKYFFNYDVTEKINNEELWNNGKIEIILPNMIIPEPAEGGGFHPELGEWEEIEEEVKMDW